MRATWTIAFPLPPPLGAGSATLFLLSRSVSTHFGELTLSLPSLSPKQAPLQPLQDNLESQTYETFEKDVTKYACYQAAVAAALTDRVPDSEVDSVTTVLMVVGAGETVAWGGSEGKRVPGGFVWGWGLFQTVTRITSHLSLVCYTQQVSCVGPSY